MNYYDLPEGKAFLISVKGLIFNNAGQVLFLKTSNIDPNEHTRAKWELPGGLIEIDESLQEGLIREIKEECGLEVEVKELLVANESSDKRFRFRNGTVKDVRIIILVFKCQSKEGDVKLSEEHSEYLWTDINKVKGLELIANGEAIANQIKSRLGLI